MADSRIVGDNFIKSDRNKIRRDGQRYEKSIQKFRLPVIYPLVFELLDYKSISRLALTSKFWNKATQSLHRASELLQLIFNSYAIPSDYPNNLITKLTETPDFGDLLLQRAKGKEPNGREWKTVSVMEYLTWSGNISVLQLLIELISPKQQKEALKQITNVKENGTEHGAVLLPLVTLNEQYTERNEAANRGATWTNLCGMMAPIAKRLARRQQLLPLNLLQWYFGEKKLDPIPEFTQDPTLSSESAKACSNYPSNWNDADHVYVIRREDMDESYLHKISKAGFEHTSILTRGFFESDGKAMQALYKTKIEQINELIDSLSKQLTQEKPAMKM